MKKIAFLLLLTLSSNYALAFPLSVQTVLPAKGRVFSTVMAHTQKVELTVLNHLEDVRFGCRNLTVISTPEYRFLKGSKMSLKVTANCTFIKQLWIEKEGNDLLIGYVDSNDVVTTDSVSIEVSEGTEGPSL